MSTMICVFLDTLLQGKGKQYFYWDGMSAQTYKKCALCVVCVSVKGQGSSTSKHSSTRHIKIDFVELDPSYLEIGML